MAHEHVYFKSGLNLENQENHPNLEIFCSDSCEGQEN